MFRNLTIYELPVVCLGTYVNLVVTGLAARGDFQRCRILQQQWLLWFYDKGAVLDTRAVNYEEYTHILWYINWSHVGQQDQVSSTQSPVSRASRPTVNQLQVSSCVMGALLFHKCAKVFRCLRPVCVWVQREQQTVRHNTPSSASWVFSLECLK